MKQRNYIILDACVLLNLLATGILEEILSLVAQRSMICLLVKDESLYLRNEVDVSENEAVELIQLVQNGILNICDFESDVEQELFVNFAVRLDDGEAMSLALALSRNWHLATDDKKARKVFIENNPDNQFLISTSDLIKEWAISTSADNIEVKNVLVRVERKARFRPPNSDVNLQWWNDILSTE